MSNLGWYQKMTTLAKKTGGPLGLAGVLTGTGFVVGALVGRAWAMSRANQGALKIQGKAFEVKSPGTDEQGLAFNIGDTYTVLEMDGNAVLIEKDGDSDNPYFVSAEFLRDISDFPL